MGRMNVLVVIYNSSLKDSRTIGSLPLADDLQIYIADNSTKDYGNQEYAEAHGYYYVGMGGNKGLSKAYNRVIAMLEKNDDFICLFDDDTTVDERYFDALRSAAAAHEDIDVFAPVVMDAIGMLSPCAIDGVTCRRLKAVNDIPKKGVSVINSGMAVRLKVFADYRYDEGQFLDYIDHAFIRDVTDYESGRIFIMEDVILHQCFSGSEKTSHSVAMTRYRILKKDIAYFCRKYGVTPFERMKLLGKRRLKLAGMRGKKL